MPEFPSNEKIMFIEHYTKLGSLSMEVFMNTQRKYLKIPSNIVTIIIFFSWKFNTWFLWSILNIYLFYDQAENW